MFFVLSALKSSLLSCEFIYTLFNINDGGHGFKTFATLSRLVGFEYMFCEVICNVFFCSRAEMGGGCCILAGTITQFPCCLRFKSSVQHLWQDIPYS